MPTFYDTQLKVVAAYLDESLALARDISRYWEDVVGALEDAENAVNDLPDEDSDFAYTTVQDILHYVNLAQDSTSTDELDLYPLMDHVQDLRGAIEVELESDEVD